MRTLSSLPPPTSRFDARGFDAQPETSRPARPSPRRGRGLDSWTILLIGAIAAGLMGMLLGGALSV
ncbi:hypothetical protein FM111_11055 [Brevundimonas diminuta 3F5N]|uniref:Uncharacterized protein n=1 Tax=Brevundimonas diminuta 3F5N TaxID=1255603 RepID=A0A1R4GAV9_BREDI|nr:hypothetical protein [Brevundimonas diminuta]SJM65142.1 hypothetical protein FM111_11055 [Brevundimonas diminuta 3F5N]